jgi:hypothetical protein
VALDADGDGIGCESYGIGDPSAGVERYYRGSVDHHHDRPGEADHHDDQPADHDHDDGASAVYYANCDAARAAGSAPLTPTDPGSRAGLDKDHDGIACDD